MYWHSCQGTSIAAMSAEAAGDGEQGVGGEARGLRDARVQRHGPEREQLRGLFAQHRHRDGADDQEFGERLAELDRAARGEEAPEALDRIEARRNSAPAPRS